VHTVDYIVTKYTWFRQCTSYASKSRVSYHPVWIT